MPIPKDSVSPQVLQAQFKAIQNWTGTFADLSNITQQMLVVLGSEGIFTPACN
jgi:hypothetical protein